MMLWTAILLRQLLSKDLEGGGNRAANYGIIRRCMHGIFLALYLMIYNDFAIVDLALTN